MNITATLIIQIIAFIIFIALINKLLWGPLSAIMADRQKRIEDGLVAAERGQVEKKEAQEKVKQLLNESKTQASDIIANAQKQANAMIEEAKESATQEASKIKSNADVEITQEVSRAKIELQAQVSSLVMLGVTKILKKEVDQKTHQQALTELSQSL